MALGRKALTLRGTPGAGKSTIAAAIVAAAGPGMADSVILDTGWNVGGVRYRGGTGRYGDLRVFTAPILVLELGWAEPVDMVDRGATRNPREWIDVLRDVGREVRLFRLEVDRDEAVRRAVGRANGGSRDGSWARAWWNCYAHDDDIRLLPERAGIPERVIPTQLASPSEIARLILGTV